MKISPKLSTSEEQREVKYVGIRRIRLQYLKDSKRKMGIALWNLMEPKLPKYTYDGGFPTFSIEGLKEHGIV